MSELLERLKNAEPKFLSKFGRSKLSGGLESWNTGPQFVTNQIACECGNRNLKLLTHQTESVTGLFRKRKEIIHQPPFVICCETCGLQGELFHPARHGWNAETGSESFSQPISNLEPVSDNEGQVFCTHSYQGIENYEDLIEEDVPNPEDFFDTFTIYFEDLDSGAPRQITSYECG